MPPNIFFPPNGKGKGCHHEDKQGKEASFWVSFLAPETDMIFGDGVGAPYPPPCMLIWKFSLRCIEHVERPGESLEGVGRKKKQIQCMKLALTLQGRPPTPSPISYQFQVLKTNPKEALFSLLVFVMTTFSLSNVLMKESKACKRGRGWARPGRGHASDAKPSGTRTKRGSRGLETI